MLFITLARGFIIAIFNYLRVHIFAILLSFAEIAEINTRENMSPIVYDTLDNILVSYVVTTVVTAKLYTEIASFTKMTVCSLVITILTRKLPHIPCTHLPRGCHE